MTASVEARSRRQEVGDSLLVIVGPTAVGKTALSLHLAESLQGEIVSADSRLFYRGMDVGTAKPTPEERARVPHHLIDVAAPDETVGLAEFHDQATAAIADIHARGKLPLLVGGTGQYVRAGIAVGTLLGTDTAEIVVPLPVAALPWIDLPRSGGRGAAAKVHFAAGDRSYVWPGRLVRSLGEVDPLGRMARLVVAVADPYLMRRQPDDDRPALAVGSFVDLELQGKLLPAVSVIPRRALRDGDTVWLVDQDSLLQIRPVQVLRRERESVVIGDGLQDGDRVIVTALAGAADGLKVRVRGEEAGK